MSEPGRPQGHVRNVSSDARRVVMPRRSTKGPLDLDMEPAPTPPTPTERPRAPYTPALQTNLPPSPGPGGARGSEIDPSMLLSPDSITSYDTPLTPHVRQRSPSPNTARPKLDLSPLLRAGLYNQIPTAGVPPPFLHHKRQPPPDTALPSLLLTGHLRLAAEKAADTLASSEISPFDIPRALELFHARLACLVLISHPEIAAKEARAFLDILAREGGSFSQPGSRATSRERPSERVNPLTLVPWDLRLLLERLKTVLTSDKRRGIMNLYQLGSECRAQASIAAKTSDADTRAMWGARLYDLGVRVASELVEMGEFETAVRHLKTLEKGGDELNKDEKVKLAVRRALLHLRMGDVEAAEACYAGLSSDSAVVVMLRAIRSMAEEDYSSAIQTLTPLLSAHPEDELVRQNLAVCLLYSGDITRASELLEGLVDGSEDPQQTGKAFSGLLFNLATIYELRTEKARDKKVLLVERVADRSASDGTIYERQGTDFKL